MITVWYKYDVFGDLTIPMRKCHGRIVALYEREGRTDFFVTSKRDGKHSHGSLHYDGNAEDFKRQGISYGEIRNACGENFDIIEYTDERDIFHVEYDPK